jgi:hypothetical protein
LAQCVALKGTVVVALQNAASRGLGGVALEKHGLHTPGRKPWNFKSKKKK